MFSRFARLVALALPVLLACILLTTGGWRVHDGRVERVSTTVPVAAPTVSQPSGPTDQTTFLHHLSPSIPWPVWVGLILLCVLPAVASMVAWSGTRRDRSSALSGSGRAS